MRPRASRCSLQNTPKNEETHKAPLTKNRFKDATTDPAQIKTWFTKWPNALIGVERLIVIDLDKHPGSQTVT